MSIETLLEAAKFLEWQALQQQKAREEDDLREKLRLNQEAEQECTEVTSLVQPVEVNHLTWSGRFCPEPRPIPVPPHTVPAPVPITVIPIPVLSASPKLLPTPSVAALAPPSDPCHSPPPAQTPQHQHLQLVSQVKSESTAVPQTSSPQQLLYPIPAPPPSQHTPLPHALPVQAPTSPTLRPALTDDPHNIDGKRRPGGAGTREVHNKLEKNRRAHLKECFETLKKTVPTVDEKKTSNLSVLRSALRYIQTLKRKEKEYEHEMERLAREKISTQQRLAELKNELGQWMNVMEMERVLRLTSQPEDDQASTSTASEGEDIADDDAEEDLLQPSPKVPHLAQAPLPAGPLQLQLPVAAASQSHAITHVSMPGVIAHASVIQASSKHVAHLAPCSAPQALAPAPCTAPQTTAPAPGSASVAQSISRITVHPVAHLYPPNVMSQLAHTLTHAHVNTLTHAQVSTLSHAQVNALTQAQVNTLSHAQVNMLSHAQVNALSQAQVNTLTQAQVNTLSHAQVNALSQAQVSTLTQAQVNTLSHAQVNALSQAQVNTLTQAHTLTQAQVNTLSHAQVNALSHAQVNALSQAQVNTLTQAHTLTQAQVNTLSHAQVNALSQAQVSTLTQAHTLTQAQVNTLSHAQVNTLSHAQVNALSHAQVNALSHAQVSALTHAQVNCQSTVVTHHSQLVGQTVLNPLTMVTMPSFPVSTLKLA